MLHASCLPNHPRRAKARAEGIRRDAPAFPHAITAHLAEHRPYPEYRIFYLFYVFKQCTSDTFFFIRICVLHGFLPGW